MEALVRSRGFFYLKPPFRREPDSHRQRSLLRTCDRRFATTKESLSPSRPELAIRNYRWPCDFVSSDTFARGLMAVTIWRIIEIAALAGAASIALAGDPAAAQSSPTKPTSAAPASDAGATAEKPQAQDRKAQEQKAIDQKASDQKAGTSAVVMDLSAIQGLIGKSVTSSAGEDMGRIVDLLVTPTGQVRAAVIDFGGFLGVGSRKVAVDWKAISFVDLPKSGSIRLALTRDQVRVSPEYKSGDPVVILETNKPTASTVPAAATEAAKAPQPVGK